MALTLLVLVDLELACVKHSPIDLPLVRTQNFRKTNVSYPLIRFCASAYNGVIKFVCRKNLRIY